MATYTKQVRNRKVLFMDNPSRVVISYDEQVLEDGAEYTVRVFEKLYLQADAAQLDVDLPAGIAARVKTFLGWS